MRQHGGVRSSWRFLNILLLVAGGWFSLAPTRLVAADAPPCSTNSESRRLDFWLGDWVVKYPGRTATAASRVSLTLDKCLLTENWEGGNGHRGETMFAYSSDDQSWHGMFADNEGRVHMFEGKVAPGAAEFTGPSRGPNGQAVLNRIKVVRIDANKVKQSWEKSADNGATWTMEFQGEYSRKNP
jgi:hypothetical protein